MIKKIEEDKVKRQNFLNIPRSDGDDNTEENEEILLCEK